MKNVFKSKRKSKAAHIFSAMSNRIKYQSQKSLMEPFSLAKYVRKNFGYWNKPTNYAIKNLKCVHFHKYI